MSNEIPVVRVNATGALIRLNNKNQRLLSNPKVTQTTATIDSDGNLVETDGADRSALISASGNLQQIGEALVSLKRQRENLLKSALMQPGGEAFLVALDVYSAEEDDQYIDPDTLSSGGVSMAGPGDISVEPLPPEALDDSKKGPAKKTAKAKDGAKASPSSEDMAEI